MIQVLWAENTKYRVFTNLRCSYTDHIFRLEGIKEKSRKILNETINFYSNSLI